jgi:hypothetical protein
LGAVEILRVVAPQSLIRGEFSGWILRPQKKIFPKRKKHEQDPHPRMMNLRRVKAMFERQAMPR